MRLRVCIPEDLPNAGVTCAWVLWDAHGSVTRSGSDSISALPAAGHIELVAPASRVLLTQTSLPERSRQRLRRLLRFAIESHITVEPERVHAALGPRLTKGVHAVAVIDREWLDSWIRAFRDADRAPRSMLVETCLAPLESDAWTVIWNDRQSFVRTGPASGMALDAASGASPPAMLQLALQEAVQKNVSPDQILVCAEAHQLPDLARWSSELGVRCVSAEAWDWKQSSGTPAIELLQGEFAPTGRGRELLPRLRPAMIISALIITIHILGTFAHWAFLSYEKSRLQAEMRGLFQTSFPAAQVIVNPSLQMRRKLNALRQASGEAQRSDFLPLLAQATSAMESSAQTHLKSISYEQGKLLVGLEMSSRAEADALLQRLKSGDAVTALDAVNAKGKGVEVQFTLSARGGE